VTSPLKQFGSMLIAQFPWHLTPGRRLLVNLSFPLQGIIFGTLLTSRCSGSWKTSSSISAASNATTVAITLHAYLLTQ
jgi:hypothetical protein